MLLDLLYSLRTFILVWLLRKCLARSKSSLSEPGRHLVVKGSFESFLNIEYLKKICILSCSEFFYLLPCPSYCRFFFITPVGDSFPWKFFLHYSFSNTWHIFIQPWVCSFHIRSRVCFFAVWMLFLCYMYDVLMPTACRFNPLCMLLCE